MQSGRDPRQGGIYVVKYFIKRIFRSIITLFLIITAVFILLRQMPVEGYFNTFEKMSPTQVRVGLANLGLDRPIHIQLFTFLKSMLMGDLGVSNRYRIKYPITSLIASIAVSIISSSGSSVVSLCRALPGAEIAFVSRLSYLPASLIIS